MMIVKTDKYRLDVYKTFAMLAKEKGLKWVVAHGAEGYPETIGRDLDVLCDGIGNIQLAIQLFKESADLHPQTKWVVDPHPIWGRRVLAVSENYEVAELHILYKLNSGLLDCSVDWNDVNKELFPHINAVTYFKSKLMPLLGGSAKIERYSNDDVASFPWSVRRLYKKNCNHQKVSAIDKLLVYIQVGGVHIGRILRNYRYSKEQTSGIPLAATTPIVYIRNNQLKDIEENLNEIFMKFVCGDALSIKDIRYHQACQRLVYLTEKRDEVVFDIDLTEVENKCCEELVGSFYLFNERKRSMFEQYFKERVRFVFNS